MVNYQCQFAQDFVIVVFCLSFKVTGCTTFHGDTWASKNKHIFKLASVAQEEN